MTTDCQILSNIDHILTNGVKNEPFFSTGMSICLKKVPHETKHKWCLGLPIHIKLLSTILDILFIGITIT